MRPGLHPHRTSTALAALVGTALLTLAVPTDSNRPRVHVAAAGVAAAELAPVSPAAGLAPVAPAAPATPAASAPAPAAARPALVQGPPAPAPPASAPAAAAGAPGTAGLLVGIDPVTGRPGPPSREFRAQLSASPALDRSMTGLTVVMRPDGSKHLDLKGRFQDYAVIRLLPDGRREQACVQGPEVESALVGKAEPGPTREYEVK